MSNTLVFDVYFTKENNVGIDVRDDLRVELFESGATTATEIRYLGTNLALQILKQSFPAGVFYSTSVDITGYAEGPVTAKWYAYDKDTGQEIEPFPFIEILQYPTASELTTSEVKTYVRESFGWPSVGVELMDNHYARIEKTTLGVLNQYAPKLTWTTVDIVPGQYQYPLPFLTSRGPADVHFTHKSGTPLISDPLFGREYPRGQALDFNEYVLGQTFWKTLRRTTGQEPTWEWDAANKIMYINAGEHNMLAAPTDWRASVMYFENWQMNTVPESYRQWFLDFATNEGRGILAQIRGKFSGRVPSPGGELTLNSDQLASEYTTERERLIEQVRSFGEGEVTPLKG